MKLHLLKGILIFVLALILTGCTIAFRQHITNEIKFSHFVHRRLELKEDVFLVYSSGSNNIKSYTLQAPRESSSVPRSINAYLENPEAWNSYTEKILGIIPAGTRLTIYDVSYFKGLATDIIRFFVELEDPRFSHIPVDALFLIDHDLLRTTFDIDHRYLKYCDE